MLPNRTALATVGNGSLDRSVLANSRLSVTLNRIRHSVWPLFSDWRILPVWDMEHGQRASP